MSDTSPAEHPVNAATRPYGVQVGDRVWFWAVGAPPLSEDYVKPPCVQALVLAFRSGSAPWAPEWPVWLADLAYVDEGALRVLVGVPQSESSASAHGRGRSYGTGPSWHRDVTHAGEAVETCVNRGEVYYDRAGKLHDTRTHEPVT
jgi:hypothetical protein